MQQPIAQQHDQMGAQQAMSQQMVLCPVRLVYETQILVQPGDQIQPNQTFFINPQNPPPWMQNSLQTRQAIQNPVVYVQQLTNNIVPSVQQPVDQNQLYLHQNFANFQLQQQMLAQSSQEMRPTMQLANIVPNIVQNMQTSMQNERTINQSVQIQNAQIQNAQVQNAQMIQNQINVNRPVQNQMVNQPVEVQRQVFMRQQMHQQPNLQRSVATISQIQNMQQQQQQQQQNLVNIQNMGQANVGQTFVQNVGRTAPTMNNVRASITNKVGNVQPVAKIREASPDVNKSVGSPIGNVVPNVRTFMPNNYYRPIQPRPQLTNNMTNMQQKMQHIPVQTVQNSPAYNHEKNNIHQNSSNNSHQNMSNNSHQNISNNFAIIQQLNTPTINRKRKSESPDEIQRKMTSNISAKQNFTIQQNNITVTKIVNEIGTNTSPVHRPKVNNQFDVNRLENPTIKTVNNEENSKETATVIEKDKLVRNTVYPQARGRVLQDKIDEIKPPIETVVSIASVAHEPAKTIEEKVIKSEVQTKMEVDIKPEIVNVQKPKETAQVPQPVENINKVPKETKEEKIVQKVEPIEEKNVEPLNVAEEEKKVKKECDEKQAVGNRLTIKQENINILTHVVDGYVIQESNFAFPIRKPLKEKTLHNMKKEGNECKDLIRESIKEELKNNVDIPLLPFHYLLLDSNKEEMEKEKEKVEEQENVEEKGKDNPFNRLQHSTIKSWTVDDLSTHLLKFNWKDTVSLLQEHEIDGESLYLVSKQQLLTIGVTEDHADIICEFVKS